MEELAIKFGMGLLGLLTFVVFTSFDKLKDPGYGLNDHFKENHKRWIWAVSMLILIVSTIQLEPKIGGLINSSIGLDLVDATGSYWVTGLALAKFIKTTVKKAEDNG